MEWYSIFFISFIDSIPCLHNSLSKISSISSHPLFSCFITLYTLILLYIPTLFLTIILSPLFNSIAIFFLSFLFLSTPESGILDSDDQKSKLFSNSGLDQKWGLSETHKDLNPKTGLSPELEAQQVVAEEDPKWVYSETGSASIRFYEGLFLEWNMNAPLEIIYEGEEENDDVSDEKRVVGLERHPSLSMYFPESESDSSSEDDIPVTGKWEMPEKMIFKWEEEELIEIALDHYGKKSIDFYHFEEDNLIEIDIFRERE